MSAFTEFEQGLRGRIPEGADITIFRSMLLTDFCALKRRFQELCEKWKEDENRSRGSHTAKHECAAELKREIEGD